MCDETYGDTAKQKERQAKIDLKTSKSTNKKKRPKVTPDLESKNSTDEDEDTRPMKPTPLHSFKRVTTPSSANDIAKMVLHWENGFKGSPTRSGASRGKRSSETNLNLSTKR